MIGGIRVLYAEDDPADADLTRAHFAEHAPDFEIEIAANGRDALARLGTSAPDLLLVDHRLPDMDGLEVLREVARSGAALPVVLVTGVGTEELVVRALRLGASSYVAKSDGYLQDLPALLRSVLDAHRARCALGVPSGALRRVLYVEHLEMDVELTTRHFAEHVPHVDLEVVRALADARERLGRSPALDAAVIDLRMPGESGIDFVRDCRRRGLAMPPFVVVTGKGDEAAAVACLSLGAADYVVKRHGYLDQLPAVLERAIAHDRLERLAERLQSELAVRQHVEAQLLRSQRMEAVGRLAGGVAHDFNNLLSVIISYTELALEEAPPTGGQLRDDLQEALAAAMRASGMARQLLAFSRKQVLQPVPLSLNEVARGLDRMLRRLLGEDVEFVLRLDPELGVVRADPAQMEQVIMNLAVNARDAMPAGGRLTLETSNVEVEAEVARGGATLERGRWVRLAMADNGCGIDDEVRARLFEPFFTTKEIGKGTGLGLSTVYGIVQQSGGQIAVQSEPGRGATFEIFLPRDAAAPVALCAAAPVTRLTGTETILVVEDEEPLRKVARRALEAAGYEVLTAADGAEALELAAAHRGDLHFLFTDVVMPRMSGRVLAEELAKLRPSAKVIFTSGYTNDAIVHHGVVDAGTPFLAKPYTAVELTRKLREVLDGARPAPR